MSVKTFKVTLLLELYYVIVKEILHFSIRCLQFKGLLTLNEEFRFFEVDEKLSLERFYVSNYITYIKLEKNFRVSVMKHIVDVLVPMVHLSN